MMTLSGLALGIGMLVDNSIVVIENIYRLRSRGISAPRAAVQGAKQVAGAITSSTLTTVCVFLPMVFTTGMVRELLLPLGLCIGYCLMASLLVALTVVPAAASTLLRRSTPKPQKLFAKFVDKYGIFLNWCLNHKIVPLLTSIALLIATIWAVLNMGIVLLPEMSGTQITVNVSTPAGITREESYAMADKVIDQLLAVDGIEEVGVMDSGSTSGLLGGMSMGGGSSYGSYVYYIVLPDDTPSTEVDRITRDINAITSEVKIQASAGGIDDMTALLGSGLSLKIYGDDLDTLKQLSEELVEIVKGVEGYSGVRSSFSDGEPTIQLVIDRDKAMAKGLTVAQIYMAISEKMTTSSSSTNVTLDGVNMSVTVHNNNDPLTVENLLDIEFETSTMDLTGTAVKQTHKLSEFATSQKTTSVGSIDRENQTRYVTVSAGVKQGYNATLLARTLAERLESYTSGEALPYGYTVMLDGESSTVNDMVSQMLLLILLGCVFIYLVMVAQFQSLLSPFIVLFTVPLAFTGGMFGLLIVGEQLSLLSMMGFAVLMGTIVNNGIVFVDYVNQLRLGGLDRRTALIATGKTRMRPILMTALTTILAMMQMIFSDDMAGQLGGGMAIVIVGGLAYGTLMTLVIIPVLYDIFFKKRPYVVDIGTEDLNDAPDDAAEYLESLQTKETEAEQAEESE
jgi:multidrug efflux pump subunit AcrB